MTDYLALALEQGENTLSAEAEEEVLPLVGEGEPGGHLFRMEKTTPRPPEKMPGGESFDPLSPWTPTLNDQGRGAAAPLALEPSPSRPTEGEEARFPHSVAGTGHGGPEDLSAPGGLEELSGPAATSKPTKFGRINGELYRQNGHLQRFASDFGGLAPQHRSPQGPGAAAHGGFLGGPGGYSLTSKNSPPGTFVSTGDKMIPDPALGQGIPSAGADAVLPLLRQMRQAQWSTGFVQSQRRQFTVALPEAVSTVPPLSAEDLDLACERDARRYGGGFGLY